MVAYDSQAERCLHSHEPCDLGIGVSVAGLVSVLLNLQYNLIIAEVDWVCHEDQPVQHAAAAMHNCYRPRTHSQATNAADRQ